MDRNNVPSLFPLHHFLAATSQADLLIGLKAGIICTDEGIHLQTQKMMHTHFPTPQWWAIDLLSAPVFGNTPDPHVTLCYDPTGCNPEMEDYFSSLIGEATRVRLIGTVSGEPGTALIVQVEEGLWKRNASLVAPHVTTSVRTDHTAKELGYLTYELCKQASNILGEQYFSQGTLEYWKENQIVEGVISHHQPRQTTWTNIRFGRHHRMR